jgi:SpoIIAA-like
MSAEIASVAGQVLTVKVSGTLTEPELTSMQASAARIVSTGGRWRVLVLTENFAGWERGGSWNDFSFSDSDASIERMAIVGDRKWEDLALIFTAKGLRSFPIEFFPPDKLAAAQDWLAAR